MNTIAAASIYICPNRRFYGRIQAAAARAGIILLLILVVSVSVCPATEADARHHLQVELFPEKQTLQAVDQITIEKNPEDRLDFKLSRRAGQIEVTVNGRFRKFDFEDGIGINRDIKPA